MMAMLWLIVCAAGVIVALVGCCFLWKSSRSQSDAASYQVVVGLHMIRRRFDVFQFRVETRRDAAHVKRQLRDELRDLNKRERGS